MKDRPIVNSYDPKDFPYPPEPDIPQRLTVAQLVVSLESTIDQGFPDLMVEFKFVNDKTSEPQECLERDKLWCKALVSLLGEGLNTDHIELITRRVNQMRDGKFPKLWPVKEKNV
jgi:hypothetical protein